VLAVLLENLSKVDDVRESIKKITFKEKFYLNDILQAFCHPIETPKSPRKILQTI